MDWEHCIVDICYVQAEINKRKHELCCISKLKNIN